MRATPIAHFSLTIKQNSCPVAQPLAGKCCHRAPYLPFAKGDRAAHISPRSRVGGVPNRIGCVRCQSVKNNNGNNPPDAYPPREDVGSSISRCRSWQPRLPTEWRATTKLAGPATEVVGPFISRDTRKFPQSRQFSPRATPRVNGSNTAYSLLLKPKVISTVSRWQGHGFRDRHHRSSGDICAPLQDFQHGVDTCSPVYVRAFSNQCSDSSITKMRQLVTLRPGVR